jgi:hypothetical protein
MVFSRTLAPPPVPGHDALTYRADCWAALEAEPSLSAAALARRTYASFATAWQVKRDFAIAGSPRRRGTIRARPARR